MGYGDFKLLAALGAWLGWQQLPALLFISSLPGCYLFFIDENKKQYSNTTSICILSFSNYGSYNCYADQCWVLIP